MGVALGAAGGEPEPGGAGGGDAVGHGVEAELEGVDAAFFIEHGVAMESGGGDLFRSGIGKHVAGELLDGELIESFIGVERFDDVVAVGPDGAVAVFFVAVGIGVAGEVEPAAGPALAVARRFQEVVDDDSEGLGSWVGGELVGNFDGRRKADEVEVDAADEGEGIGLVSEVVFYEVINGVDVGGDGRFFGQDEGPMFFVLRALSDPLFEEGDLGGREGLVGLGGRHDFIRVVGGDAGDDFVPILVVGDVETEVGFAHGLAVFTLAVIGAVAFEAVGGEDGADVFREGEFFRIFGSKDAPDAADESCKEERWDF